MKSWQGILITVVIVVVGLVIYDRYVRPALQRTTT